MASAHEAEAPLSLAQRAVTRTQVASRTTVRYAMLPTADRTGLSCGSSSPQTPFLAAVSRAESILSIDVGLLALSA
ncbi:hypothetical protein [Bifidobacterium bifidum]|uniref:hypothetical protein n=1 Tax=Bifidobacterium bifidum TaxID=1681 RepID=UPI0020B2A331|nr:hypothetical protein [Bifidobacterium bifidum]